MLDNSLTIQSLPKGTPPNSQPIYNGPWIVGENCHIIIDGVGYIIADNISYAQESMRAMGSEQTAPFFGDPVNFIDPQSSDMTMLLPIGQNDFTDGIGSAKLEIDPKGYELSTNLQLTPQNTLFNGPQIKVETINAASPTDSSQYWTEGYFGGMTSAGTDYDYFSIGSNLFHRQSGVWQPLTTHGPVRSLFGYAGYMLASYGDSGGDLFNSANASWPILYNSWRAFRVDGQPFIIYKDGRIYSAFLNAPNTPVSIQLQTGPDTNYLSWEYCVQYLIQLPDSTFIHTSLGPASMIDKPANQETVVELPTIPWKSGPVLRQLYRSKNNDPTNLYLLADTPALGALRSQWVDTATDASLTAAWDWTTTNNTAMTILRAGTLAHNMWRSDTQPIFMPEGNALPNSGDFVWHAETFRDISGNEAVILGTTAGLFEWDGATDTTRTLRKMDHDFFNCHSLAVNHGQVYFTSSVRQVVHTWTNTQESFLNGPWQIQYELPYDIRLVSSGEYVYFGVCGQSKYGDYRQTIYRYNGNIFDWQTNIPTAASGTVCPVIGKVYSENSFGWYPNNGQAQVNRVSMDPRYTDLQTSNLRFRSALSDCGLPRLRKQVFAVMIRYLQLSAPTMQTTLTQSANPGDAMIHVGSTTGLNVGDWIAIDDPFPNFQEYRQVTATTGTTISFSHPLTNGALVQSHNSGIGVFKSSAVVTLRNVFTADNPTPRDIQIGGPFRSDYLFAYIHLPVPVYTFLDGIQIDWNNGTVMELIGWSMLTALNPPYYGLLDLNIRVQDQVKLPNNLFHPYSGNDLINALRTAYDKGAVTVIDQFNNLRQMRVQRMSVDYEEPKQRHPGQYQNQASAHIRLLDQDSELFKQEALVLGIPTNQ